MRSPCNDIFFIQLYTRTLCIFCMEEDFQYFEKYICIYTEYFATSSHYDIKLGSFLLTKTFMSIMSRLIYCKSLYILFWWACCSPLLYFFITQQQLGKMARLQQTQRKRVGSVPRLPVDVVAAIAAEVDLL